MYGNPPGPGHRTVEAMAKDERNRLFHLRTAGLSPTHERWFDILSVVVALVFGAGWSYAIATTEGDAHTAIGGTLTSNPLSPDAPPPAAYALDLALRALTEQQGFRGLSGALNVVIREPGDTSALADSLPGGAELEYEGPGRAARERADPATPGVWNLLIRARDEIRRIPDLRLITQVPATEVRSGRLGRYQIGQWPARRSGKFTSDRYDPPTGLIRVTPENRDLPVSEHFTLGDFLTKGQGDVWPKYIVLSTRLLDKLELTVQQLEEMGHPVENVGMISGFRTPNYNRSGGDPSGRGNLSRHMYGDAADIFIDNDGDGQMDDLNGDGRVNREDARILVQAAEAVERRYPSLAGGIGLYGPNPGAHAGFVHIDTRGYRARW